MSGSELLDLSSAIVDGKLDGPTSRITNELSELDDGLAIIESFSNIVALNTGDGLVLFDASSVFTAQGYTHGHVDHVGGSGFIASEAKTAGHELPNVVGHEAVGERFERYRQTDGWNKAINARQFGPGFGDGVEPFLAKQTLECSHTYRDQMDLDIGGLKIELHHDKGETDDHTWAWIPSLRAVAVGDLVAWVFPNAGNPQKVQRYPVQWAAALRRMIALEPELLLPAHGLAVSGRARVATVLGDVATVLEQLVHDVLAAMNTGATLDEILHSVRVDDEMLARPWLRPIYDEPEFVVRNIYRLFGGWWDGDPAHLKPPPAQELARELTELAGGVDKLVQRAEALAQDGNYKMACQLIEFAARSSEDEGVWNARSQMYLKRAEAETSLMAKGVFGEAARR